MTELRSENEKLQYRCTHVVRALKQADAERPPPPHPPLKGFATSPFAYASPLTKTS